jgi:hypothetical protein
VPGLRPWLDQLERTGRRTRFCADEPAGLIREFGWSATTLTGPGQHGADVSWLTPAPEHRLDYPAIRTYLVAATKPAPERPRPVDHAHVAGGLSGGQVSPTRRRWR